MYSRDDTNMEEEEAVVVHTLNQLHATSWPNILNSMHRYRLQNVHNLIHIAIVNHKVLSFLVAPKKTSDEINNNQFI